MPIPDTPNHRIAHVRSVIPWFNLAYQLPSGATKLVGSGRQSAVALLTRETAVDKGDGPLGRLVTEIGRAAQAGWPQTARLIVLLAVVAGAAMLVLMASR
jgi:hypothetical protein